MIRTARQFRGDTEQHRRNVHLRGKLVNTPARTTEFVPGFNAVALTFQAAEDAQTRELATAHSPFIDGPVSRFNHIPHSKEDLIRKVDLVRLCATQAGACIQRCISSDALTALYVVTSRLGAPYHDRFIEFLKTVQKRDLVVASAQTDSKGDRKKRPHAQANPDAYLRVVSKDASGIVLRGVKQHDILAPYADEMIVLPSRSLTSADGSYAVSFAIPVDTPELQIVSRTTLPERVPVLEAPLSRQYGFTSNTLIFRDVFVPWERVFLCGETEAASQLARLFGTYHRHSNCGCRTGQTDVMVGAAMLMAQLNGVDREPHVRAEIIELCIIAETVYGVALGAAAQAVADATGAHIPEPNLVNVAQYQSRVTAGREYTLLQDIAGGLTVTMPHEEDFSDERLHADLEPAFTAAKGSGTDRIRAAALVADLVASGYGGWRMVAETVGGVGVHGLEVAMNREYDLEARLRMAKRLIGMES
jgi:4-hydroxyphenylacetate 3-monooxygenase/4-hydroxybutyryl-CoA dehydratase/vinylacetyl-CoA-Delta-isomerase